MLKITLSSSEEAIKLKFTSPSTSVALKSITKDSPSWIFWLGIGVTIGASLIDRIVISNVPISWSAGSGNSKSGLSEQSWKVSVSISTWQLE